MVADYAAATATKYNLRVVNANRNLEKNHAESLLQGSGISLDEVTLQAALTAMKMDDDASGWIMYGIPPHENLFTIMKENGTLPTSFVILTGSDDKKATWQKIDVSVPIESSHSFFESNLIVATEQASEYDIPILSLTYNESIEDMLSRLECFLNPFANRVDGEEDGCRPEESPLNEVEETCRLQDEELKHYCAVTYSKTGLLVLGKDEWTAYVNQI